MTLHRQGQAETEVAIAEAACAALKARGWRPIAMAHVRYVRDAGVPVEVCSTPLRSLGVTGRDGRGDLSAQSRAWVPEWAAILLQIACIKIERAAPSQVRGGAGIQFVIDNVIPTDRRVAVEFLLKRATADEALRSRLLGISAWADLETDDRAYESQAFLFIDGLLQDAVRWSWEQP